MNRVLVVTTNDCPGYRIVEVLGTVYGSSVRSRNVVGSWIGGISALFGGRQDGATRMAYETMDDALEKIIKSARKVGANAVIAMRFNAGEFDSGQRKVMEMVTAYGTAVVLEKIPPT
jgi:uncharacterized protein YbjQ (UPF0145 family)